MSEPELEAAAARVAKARRTLEAVAEAVGGALVGQRDVIREVVVALGAGGHVLLEGVPGIGKTLLVRSLAAALEARYARIQFTPDLMPSDVLGNRVVLEDEATGRRSFVFEPGPVFTNVLLADEINRATPKTQSALLEAMAEGAVTTTGERRPLPDPFFVLATQNPVEMEGTFPLPEAQLDRFFAKVLVPAPGREDLEAIGLRTTGPPERPVAPVATVADLLAARAVAREVALAPHVLRHAAELVLATQPASPLAPEVVRRAVRHGASPRGVQALVLGAKVRALLAGRFAATVADVRAQARSALRHRLILSFEGEASGASPERLVEAVLAAVPGESA